MSGDDDNRFIEQRRKKLAALREQGNAYPNDFQREDLVGDLYDQYESSTADELKKQMVSVKAAGRIMAVRAMGKSTFAQLRDMSGDIQLFIKQDDLGESLYQDFQHGDIGDIVGVEGTLMKTQTEELSIRVKTINTLVKSLRPLPEKFHGLKDIEIRYRQRYIDLAVNQEVREVFKLRSEVIRFIQNYFDERGFYSVETPMMHAIVGGARAKPFITHHNALDSTLYLRIAPELYLKRLVVGGFEKVYEINRSFRNEGVSTHHNPEFTMLEFYAAYDDYHGFMEFTEHLLRSLCLEVCGKQILQYGDQQIDFSRPFARMTIKQAVLKYQPDLDAATLADYARLSDYVQDLGLEAELCNSLDKLIMVLFEKKVEQKLIQPTFVTGYPVSQSPLSRRNDNDPDIADRFELFIAGQEIANGFSELNDPDDQAERFALQLKEKQAGDEEAMDYDHDYIIALEYGLPPTAGEGIGIDRLVMLLTDSASIRDVILFPQMKLKN